MMNFRPLTPLSMRFRKEDLVIWNGLESKASIDWADPYVRESMSHTLKYCEITRKAFGSGWRWYVIFIWTEKPRKNRTPGTASSKWI